MTDAERLKALEDHVRNKIPGFRIAYKNLRETIPWWLKIGFWIVSLFNKRFWTNYITVIGSTVWWPSKEDHYDDLRSAFVTLAHEYVHMHDNKLKGLAFNIGYMMPQVLAPLCLLGFLGFLWAPLFTLFAFALALIPWPSPWRAKYELRGYKMTIAVRTWLGDDVSEESLDFFTAKFTGKDYYFMSPGFSKSELTTALRQARLTPEIFEGIYQEVRKIAEA
jgi:hypothetical protein